MSYSTMSRQVSSIDYDDLLRLYEQQLERDDIRTRAIRNPKMSAAYRLLFVSMLDTYTNILNGEKTAINVWQIRENAGWISERTVSYFLNDLQAIGALIYDPGQYSKDEEKREGFITTDIDIFPYPEKFDTRSTEGRKKARESEKEKRDAGRLALLILQCENCGSSEIRYDLLPTCKECGHKHAPLTGIDASRLTIALEKADAAGDMPGLDDFMHKEPAPPAASFNDYSLDSYAGGCANWNKHRAKWKQYKSGLHCPECEPAYK